MIKLLGALLFILCGGILGYGKLSKLKKRLSVLESIDDALAVMDGEIFLCERPLPDIYMLMAERNSDLLRDVFLNMNEDCLILSAGRAWCKGIRDLDLTEEAEKILLGLGSILGVVDGQRQSAEIKNARAALWEMRNRLRNSLQEKGKSYPLLGVCFAGILALVII